MVALTSWGLHLEERVQGVEPRELQGDRPGRGR